MFAMHLQLFVLLLSSASSVYAQKVGFHSELGFACWNAAFKYDFNCTAQVPYNDQCQSAPFMLTVLQCINSYGTCSGKVKAAHQYIHDVCHYWGNLTLDSDDMLDYYNSRLNTSRSLESHGLIGSVNIPPELFNEQIVAARATSLEYEWGNKSGLAIVAYWSIIVGFAVVFNVWKLANREHLNSLFGKRLTNFFRSKITLPALLGEKHFAPQTISGVPILQYPTRGQSIIIAGFILVNIICMCLFHHANSPLPLSYIENSHKIARYISVRCGIMSIHLLPITVLFACRNNPFIALTGWSHGTFQLYHRWNARMMTLLVILHGTLLTWYSCRENIVLFKWRHVHNWPAGNLSAYAMILMLCFSIKCIRRNLFELFLALHQFLFLVVLVALTIHISDYGWRAPLIITLVFYFFEYICRWYKVIRSGGVQQAEFSLIVDDVYRVNIANPKRWEFRSGQYVHIRVLTKGMFWQSHPFSVMNESQHNLEFMIKAKTGLTAKVLAKLREAPSGKFTSNVFIEGPYGHDVNLRNYRSLVLLAAGVGITALYAHATSKDRDICQKLTLIWVIKSRNYLTAFGDQLEALDEIGDRANIAVYLTDDGADPEAGSSDRAWADKQPSFFNYGRPCIADILEEHFRAGYKTTAVCACGPPTFLDTARNEVRRSVRKGRGLIDYFEEGFSW